MYPRLHNLVVIGSIMHKVEVNFLFTLPGPSSTERLVVVFVVFASFILVFSSNITQDFFAVVSFSLFCKFRSGFQLRDAT